MYFVQSGLIIRLLICATNHRSPQNITIWSIITLLKRQINRCEKGNLKGTPFVPSTVKWCILDTFKEVIHTTMSQSCNAFFCLQKKKEKKNTLKNVGVQKTLYLTDFQWTKNKIYFSKYFLLCSKEESHACLEWRKGE